jgi:hypothetical protein
MKKLLILLTCLLSLIAFPAYAIEPGLINVKDGTIDKWVYQVNFPAGSLSSSGATATYSGGGTVTAPILLPNGSAAAPSLQWNLTIDGSSYCYPFQIIPNDETKGPFGSTAWSVPFAGVNDFVWGIGYNFTHGGGKIVATEPSFHWVIEQDWYTGTVHYLESYFEWVSKDGTKQWRPFHVLIDRDSNAVTLNLGATAGVSFINLSNDNAFANVNLSSLYLNGDPTQTDDTVLYVGAQNGKRGTFQMAGGFNIIPLNNNEWHIQIGSTANTLHFYPGQVALNTTDNSGTLTIIPTSARKDYDTNLVLIKVADQSTRLFDFYHFRTDGSNYEGGYLTAAAGSVTLGARTAGTGTDNIDLLLVPAGTGAVGIGSTTTAGAQTGTLTNSVAAGNPAVWFKIKSGASYYAVPGWLIP